jgi:hypothetical protein
MVENPLIGTWKLDSCQIDLGGLVVEPLGKNPVGYLTYTAEGYMCAAIMSEDATAGGGDEVTAADSYISYCGSYEFFGDRVVHHVTVSLMRDMVGKVQERTVDLIDNRLILSTPPLTAGSPEQMARFTWIRC